MSEHVQRTRSTLPEVLRTLQNQLREDIDPGDISAQELMEALDFAWLAAERYRLEQFDWRVEGGCSAIN
jgi:hypothetical protein